MLNDIKTISTFGGLSKILLFLIIFLLSFGLLRYIIFSYTLLKYPFEYAEGEGHSFTRAKLLSEGESIYRKNDSYPIIANPHQPLYFFLWAILIKFFGASFFHGRLISLIASIIVGFLIFKIIKEKTNNNLASIIGAGLFYISEYIIIGMNFAERNSLALALSLTAVYFVSRYKQGWLNLLLAAIFLISAIYTNKSFIFVWAALAAWIFIENRYLAIKYNPTIALVLFLIFLFMQYKYNGLFFHFLFVAPKYYRYNFFSSIALLGFYFLNSIIFLYIIVIDFLKQKRKFHNLSVWKIVFIMVFLQTILISSQTGRWFPYLMPLYALTCILLGFSIGNIMNNRPTKSNFVFMLLIVQIILISASNYIVNLTRYKSDTFASNSPLLFNGPTRDSLENGKKVLSYIRDTPGDIIAFQSESFIALCNKKIFFEGEGAEFGLFDRKGITTMLNPQFVINDIKKKRFALVMVDGIILPKEKRKNSLETFLDFIIGKHAIKVNELNYDLAESVAKTVFENYKLVNKVQIKKRGHWVTVAMFKPKT